MTSSIRQRPVKVITVRGGIRAAVWQHDVERNGRRRPRFSITVSKRFYDKGAGQYRESGSFFPDDIPRLRLALDKAFEYAMLRDGDSDTSAT